MWNSIGNKPIAMAQDFPEDKYDFKVQKDQRTFAQTLLHVAGVDYLLMRTVSGSNIGPDLGKECSSSRTAASTMASSWCTIAPTTWCRRHRGRDKALERSRLKS